MSNSFNLLSEREVYALDIFAKLEGNMRLVVKKKEKLTSNWNIISL